MNTENNNDFDYTIVLDSGMTSVDLLKQAAAQENPESVVEDEKAAAERLYYEYETMCMKMPMIVDKDDAYPRSYQWRIGDRYDPAKLEVIKEAIRTGKTVMDTEAYQEYLEEIKNRSYRPVSWE